MTPSDTSLIFKYFPELTQTQKTQFSQLKELYEMWNAKINVISRKDIDYLYERHVLHSLAIAKVAKLKSRNNILDVGTGGGLPGIPLAILFPECQFHLVDSVGKKIKVVDEIKNAIGLKNVVAEQARAEELSQSYNYIVNRAVAPLLTLWHWADGKLKQGGKMLCLKGGDLKQEIDDLVHDADISSEQIKICSMTDFFKETFFQEKKIIVISL